jgi:hypothetical protein
MPHDCDCRHRDRRTHQQQVRIHIDLAHPLLGPGRSRQFQYHTLCRGTRPVSPRVPTAHRYLARVAAPRARRHVNLRARRTHIISTHIHDTQLIDHNRNFSTSTSLLDMLIFSRYQHITIPGWPQHQCLLRTLRVCHTLHTPYTTYTVCRLGARV